MLNKIDAVAEGTHTWPMAEHVFARDGQRCQYCGITTANNYVMEHVIPWSMGGHTATYNLVVACQSCNNSKRSKVWMPVNIDVLDLENPEWAEQIRTLAMDPFTNPALEMTIPANLSWALVFTAQAQDITVEAALGRAVRQYVNSMRMTVIGPPDEEDEDEDEPPAAVDIHPEQEVRP